MKHIIYSLALISLFTGSARAQSLERQVIGSAGSYSTASWGSLSATTGEPRSIIYQRLQYQLFFAEYKGALPITILALTES